MAKTVLRIPSICGIYGFESIARRQPLVSLANYETVEFDFSGLSGISILPLSIIFGWMSFLRKKQINVYARFPTNESDHHLPQALSRMHLAHALSAINVRHVGVLPRYSGSGLAAFKTFDGLMDLQAYKNSMESATTRKSLVGASDEIEFVNTGDFRNILLHELGENAFDHGKGEHVRFALCEHRRPVEQRSDGFLPQFDEPFIEMVVSDSGPGIATTLRSSFPSNWKPEYVGSQALSRGARICAYALEFSSTSQQAKRKNRLSQLMADAGDFVNVVPTGLYYVATVVRHYCGQLIVRTGQTFVCFDYTNPANPRVHENSQTSKHSDIPGTHILARIPRNRSSKPSNYPPIPNTGSATNYDLADPRTILLADLWTKSARAPADFILLFEQEVERILASYPAKRKRVLVVLANGLDADTKSVSLILTWLGTIPRREWIIFVAGLPLDRMPPTRLQSQTIESMLPGQNPIASVHRFQAWQSYLITTEDLSESLVFGGSKHVSDLHVMSRGMYLVALKVAIRNKIESAPIKHIERPNRFYLLQGGKYYTQKFYEIGQLVSTSNTSGLAFATAYVTHLLKQHNISTVINLAPPLMEFATHIATCTPTVKVIVSPPNNSMADVIQALRQHKSSGRLLLITDVICTGRSGPANLNKAISGNSVDNLG